MEGVEKGSREGDETAVNLSALKVSTELSDESTKSVRPSMKEFVAALLVPSSRAPRTSLVGV